MKTEEFIKIHHVPGRSEPWFVQTCYPFSKELPDREFEFESGACDYRNALKSLFEKGYETAQTMSLGASKEDVLDALFGLVSKKHIDLPKKLLTEVVDLAEMRGSDYGDPRSMWAIVNGLTEVSQNTPHADERVKIDRAAGKLLEVAVF